MNEENKPYSFLNPEAENVQCQYCLRIFPRDEIRLFYMMGRKLYVCGDCRRYQRHVDQDDTGFHSGY